MEKLKYLNARQNIPKFRILESYQFESKFSQKRIHYFSQCL